MSQKFDFIVVGAGTAGCLLANRLSANGKYSVALLEAGGSDNYHWVHIPVGYLYCMGNKRTEELLKPITDETLEFERIFETTVFHSFAMDIFNSKCESFENFILELTGGAIQDIDKY